MPSQCSLDCAHDGGDDLISDSIDYFLGLTHITSMGTMLVTILVDGNIILIKIQKIQVIYKCLNYFLLYN